MRVIELHVEAVERTKRFAADEQVGGHKAQPLEALICHRTELRVVAPIPLYEPLHSDDAWVCKVRRAMLEPVWRGLTIVVGEGDDVAAGVERTGVARVYSAPNVGVEVEDVKPAQNVVWHLPRRRRLIDDNHLEVAVRLRQQTVHES